MKETVDQVKDRIGKINDAAMRLDSFIFALSDPHVAKSIEKEGMAFSDTYVYKLLVKEMRELIGVVNHEIEFLNKGLGFDDDTGNIARAV